MKCPGCKHKLYLLPVPLDDGVRDCWAHPKVECQYKNDGLSFDAEVLDQFVFEKFQQLVGEEGLADGPKQDVKAESFSGKTAQVVFTPEQSFGPLKVDSDEVVLKRRLAAGQINYHVFDECKRRLLDSW